MNIFSGVKKQQKFPIFYFSANDTILGFSFVSCFPLLIDVILSKSKDAFLSASYSGMARQLTISRSTEILVLIMVYVAGTRLNSTLLTFWKTVGNKDSQNLIGDIGLPTLKR